MARLAGRLLLWAVLALVGGYGVYLASVAATRPDPQAEADAIVVLTGGPDRLRTALVLLEQGRGERLLISGVSSRATEADIRAMAPQDAVRFDCCVDLDRVAANTRGNARETARWAYDRGYTRLLLVTDAFHMPRARLELAREAPDLAFSPWPSSRWGARGLRGSVVEYAKLLVILAREAAQRVREL